MTSGDDWDGMSLLRLPSPTQRKFGYENENAGDVDRESFRQGRRPVCEIKVTAGASEIELFVAVPADAGADIILRAEHMLDVARRQGGEAFNPSGQRHQPSRQLVGRFQPLMFRPSRS